MKRVRAIMNSPWFDLAIGVFLLISGLLEVLHVMTEEPVHRVGAHHGVTVYGLAAVMKAASEILEGALKAEEAIADAVMLGEVVEEAREQHKS